ncbi:hypothetical protein M885DRAFT_561774 [Pelagophyceae sp. CCMP2097]|nr:hypothetical protein M885DRAFT_561774 [Pelagophyceae sp. CCMP2097]
MLLTPDLVRRLNTASMSFSAAAASDANAEPEATPDAPPAKTRGAGAPRAAPAPDGRVAAQPADGAPGNKGKTPKKAPRNKAKKAPAPEPPQHFAFSSFQISPEPTALPTPSTPFPTPSVFAKR